MSSGFRWAVPGSPTQVDGVHVGVSRPVELHMFVEANVVLAGESVTRITEPLGAV